jgi:hypothetical protein
LYDFEGAAVSVVDLAKADCRLYRMVMMKTY